MIMIIKTITNNIAGRKQDFNNNIRKKLKKYISKKNDFKKHISKKKTSRQTDQKQQNIIKTTKNIISHIQIMNMSIRISMIIIKNKTSCRNYQIKRNQKKNLSTSLVQSLSSKNLRQQMSLKDLL